MDCMQKKDHSCQWSPSFKSLWRVPTWQHGGNMIASVQVSTNSDWEIRLCCCSAFRLLLSSVSKCPLLQVWEQVARTDGLPVLATDCLCETKCEVICCDQNPGQTGNSLPSHRRRKGAEGNGETERERGWRVKGWKPRVLSSSALCQFSLCSPSFLHIPLPPRRTLLISAASQPRR